MAETLNNSNHHDFVGDAHAELHEKKWNTKGVICPVCDKFAKVTRAPLGSGIARAMIWIYHNSAPGEFVYTPEGPDVVKRSNSHLKAKHWRLVEKAENHDPTKKDSGYSRLTAAGRLFVENKLKVAKYAFIYNDVALEVSGPDWGIIDALGKKFNYAELMQPAKP